MRASPANNSFHMLQTIVAAVMSTGSTLQRGFSLTPTTWTTSPMIRTGRGSNAAGHCFIATGPNRRHILLALLLQHTFLKGRLD